VTDSHLHLLPALDDSAETRWANDRAEARAERMRQRRWARLYPLLVGLGMYALWFWVFVGRWWLW
jgi:hypothetical protein